MYRAVREFEGICARKIRACGRRVRIPLAHHWKSRKLAFESHILTEPAVINFKHIESRRFLEDASEIVLECVQSNDMTL